MATPLLPDIQKAFESAVPFQLEDAKFAARHKKVVLGHKTGLGKTFISLLAWGMLPDVRKVLIVGTSSSLGTWRRVLRQWGGAEPVIMKGSGDPGWKNFCAPNAPGIWMCTYATFRILMGATEGHMACDLLVTDELHKALRNRTATWKALTRIDCKYFFGATATWASKGPQDLWPILHCIDRKFFSSYWRFVETWCFVNNAQFGKEIFGVRNADKLKALLANNYYRTRTWKEVGQQFRIGKENIEPVVRRVQHVSMTETQAVLYDGLATRSECRFDGELLLAQNSLDRLTKSLQMALSPALLFKTGEVGGAVEWLGEQVMPLDSAVIFLPYKGLAQICAKYFRDSGYTGEMYTLYGGLPIDVVDETVIDWRKKKGLMFCTISFAQSFDLSSADYAYFLGFDWDPNNNIQAEGRMRRFDTIFDVPCLATYIVVESTAYEAVQEVVNGKVSTVKQVLAGYGL